MNGGWYSQIPFRTPRFGVNSVWIVTLNDRMVVCILTWTRVLVAGSCDLSNLSMSEGGAFFIGAVIYSRLRGN